MKDKNKTKDQLITELSETRKLLSAKKNKAVRQKKGAALVQKKLVEYDKLSALGRLTANVAHEIRNPITIIGALTERLKKSGDLQKKQREYLDLISFEAKRLEQILREVLIFSNEPFFRKKQKDINIFLEECISQCMHMIGQHAIILRKEFRKVTPVYIDMRHMKEALVNLICNAVEAMPDGGILTLSTYEEKIGGKSYVSVEVKDTGTGIPGKNLPMIFEPFFTTKMNKKETGLGLPLTRKIIEAHGGMIKVESADGKGSAFTLYIPYRSREQ
jgi:signal transduction histidine kinase